MALSNSNTDISSSIRAFLSVPRSTACVRGTNKEELKETIERCLQEENEPFIVCTIPERQPQDDIASQQFYPLLRDCEIHNFTLLQYLFWISLRAFSSYLTGPLIEDLVRWGVTVVLLEFHHSSRLVQIDIQACIDSIRHTESKPDGHVIVAGSNPSEMLSITHVYSAPLYMRFGVSLEIV